MRAGSGLQLLQGVQCGGRDVPGGRDPGDLADEGAQAAAHAKFAGVAAQFIHMYIGSARCIPPGATPAYRIFFHILLRVLLLLSLMCSLCKHSNVKGRV